MVFLAKEIVPIYDEERKHSESAKKPSPVPKGKSPKKRSPFDIIGAGGETTPLTHETCNPLFRKKYGGGAKIIRAQRIACEQLAQAAEDRAAARNYRRELAEAERNSEKLWALIRCRIKPEEVETPQKKPRPEPEKEPKEIKDRVFRDPKAPQSVFLRIRYYSALTTKPGVGVRVTRYIFHGAKLRAEDGEPYFSSNIGTRPAEAMAAFDVVERVNASTHKNAKLLYHTIIQVPHQLSPEAQMAVGEIYAESTYGCHDLPYLVVLHPPSPDGDQRNTHLHILSSLRPMVRVGDCQWAVATMLRSDLDTKESYVEKRQELANALNEVCSMSRLDRRYTALKNVERGLPMPPQEHLGRARTIALRRGEYVHRAYTNYLKCLEGLEAMRAQKLRGLEQKLQQKSRVLRAYMARMAAERPPISAPITSVSRPLDTTMFDIEVVKQTADGLKKANEAATIAVPSKPVSRSIPMQKVAQLGPTPSPSTYPVRAQIAFEPFVTSTSLPQSAITLDGILSSSARLQPTNHLPQRLPDKRTLTQKSLPPARQTASGWIAKLPPAARVPAPLQPSPRIITAQSLPIVARPNFGSVPKESTQIARVNPMMVPMPMAHCASLKLTSLADASMQHANLSVFKPAISHPILAELEPFPISRSVSNIVPIPAHLMLVEMPAPAMNPDQRLIGEVERAMRAAKLWRDSQTERVTVLPNRPANPEPTNAAVHPELAPEPKLKPEPKFDTIVPEKAGTLEPRQPTIAILPPNDTKSTPPLVPSLSTPDQDSVMPESNAVAAAQPVAPEQIIPVPSMHLAPNMAHQPFKITRNEASIFAIITQHPYYLETSPRGVSAKTPPHLRPKLEEFMQSPHLAETMYEVQKAVTKGGNTLSRDAADLIEDEIKVAQILAPYDTARQRGTADDYQQIADCFFENPALVAIDRLNARPVSNAAPPFVCDILRDREVELDWTVLIEQTRSAHDQLRKSRDKTRRHTGVHQPNQAISNVMDAFLIDQEFLEYSDFLGLRPTDKASNFFRSEFAKLTDDAQAIFEIQRTYNVLAAERHEVDAMCLSDRNRVKITPPSHAARLMATTLAPTSARLAEANRTPYQSTEARQKQPVARKMTRHEHELGLEADFGPMRDG